MKNSRSARGQRRSSPKKRKLTGTGSTGKNLGEILLRRSFPLNRDSSSSAIKIYVIDGGKRQYVCFADDMSVWISKEDFMSSCDDICRWLQTLKKTFEIQKEGEKYV